MYPSYQAPEYTVVVYISKDSNDELREPMTWCQQVSTGVNIHNCYIEHLQQM